MEARHVEQVRDEPGDAVDLPSAGREPLEQRVAARALRELGRRALQRLHLEAQRRERRPQLVRGDGDELVANAHRVLRVAVHESVIDRLGGAASELLGEP